MKNVRIYSTIIVGLHLAIALYHAVAHGGVNVWLPLLGSLYVLMVLSLEGGPFLQRSALLL